MQPNTIPQSTLSLVERYKQKGGPLTTEEIGSAIGSVSKSGNLTDRYIPERGRVAEETSKLDAIYGDNTKPDQQTIRAEKLAQAQAQINAINSKYSQIEAADRETIDLMNRERRASNVLSGLSGSNVGATRTVETSKQGDKIQRLTAEAKNAEVSEALSNAEARASTEFLTQKENYIKNAKDRFDAEMTIRTNVKAQANTEIGAIASTMSWDEFKTQRPSLVQQYMDELETNEDGLKAYFVQANRDKLVSDKAEVLRLKDGRTVSRFYYQKPDGTMTYTDIDTPNQQKEIKQTYSTDDGIVIVYDDGTTSIVNPGGKPDSGLPTWEEYLKAAQDEARQTFTGETRAELKKQYDEQVRGATNSEKATKFTEVEQRKLEQAGLLKATRQEQLDYLYGEDEEGGDNPFG